MVDEVKFSGHVGECDTVVIVMVEVVEQGLGHSGRHLLTSVHELRYIDAQVIWGKCSMRGKLVIYIDIIYSMLKDAMPVSFRSELFTSYILTIFKQ